MPMLHYQYQAIAGSPEVAMQEVAAAGTYFVVIVSGRSAQTLAHSKRWKECAEWKGDVAGAVSGVEAVISAFLRHYNVVLQKKRPGTGTRMFDQVIEGIAVIWLDQKGNGMLFQDGKCQVSLLAQGYVRDTVGGKGEITAFEVKSGDRIVADLKQAGIAALLTSRAEVPIEAGADGNRSGIDLVYPFAVIYPAPEEVTEAEPVLEDSVLIAGVVPTQEVTAKEQVLEATEAIGPEVEEKIKERRKSNLRIVLGGLLLLMLSIAGGWWWYENEEVSPPVARSSSNENDSVKQGLAASGKVPAQSRRAGVVEKEPPMPAKTAEEGWLSQVARSLALANKYLDQGQNQQALIQLKQAERIIQKYVQANPEKRSKLQPQLDEIRQKVHLIVDEPAF